MSAGAIILSGGRSTRMGTDKAAVRIGGSSLLQRTISAVAFVDQVVVVGQRVDLPIQPDWPPISFTLEKPKFGGPVAGLAAGIDLLEAEWMFVLAVDLAHPAAVVRLLRSAPIGEDGAALVDEGGWPQFLAARYSRLALARRLSEVGDIRDMSVRRFAKRLNLALIPATDQLVRDLDTPADVADLGQP